MLIINLNFKIVKLNITVRSIFADCGGHLGGLNGALSAPQYPLKDSRTLNCDWHISVAAG